MEIRGVCVGTDDSRWRPGKELGLARAMTLRARFSTIARDWLEMVCITARFRCLCWHDGVEKLARSIETKTDRD
ncbi:hypothetical protein TIFTF001_019239 [Ficus carica]|uniref:Uncharacterized protein n=1 Tax=Ficus carica TaxID=3494 RepID=A0AA88D8R1_FICCA|nr:hypothetical protein TIFTF001_019239 [Ficus carica]